MTKKSPIILQMDVCVFLLAALCGAAKIYAGESSTQGNGPVQSQEVSATSDDDANSISDTSVASDGASQTDASDQAKVSSSSGSQAASESSDSIQGGAASVAQPTQETIDALSTANGVQTSEDTAVSKQSSDNASVEQTSDVAALEKPAESTPVADSTVQIIKEDETSTEPKKEEKAPVVAPKNEEPKVTAPEVTPKKAMLDDVAMLDTLDMDEGGNWLLKRQALEQTVDTIEQANEIFNRIVALNTDYLVKRNKVDNEMEIFIMHMGIDVGDLDQKLKSINHELEQSKKHDGGAVSSEKKDLQAQIEDKLAAIGVLQKDLNDLLEIDGKLDAVVEMVGKQLKEANDYQVQGWKNFQTIKKILNDEKARDLFYQTEGLFRSIQAVHEYLDVQLSKYFDEQIALLRNKMDAIKKAMDSLKEKGIDLHKKADEIDSAKPMVQEAPVAKKQASFIGTLVSYIAAPFVWIYNGFSVIVRSIGSLFGIGVSKAPKRAEPSVVVEQSGEAVVSQPEAQAVRKEND